MENGKNVAIEVPSAMNLQECWDLINLSEKTRKHCMILENCCYDWFEMNTLNMAQQGVFGEIIRAQGAYIHNLSPFWDHYWKNGKEDKLGWRLDYNMKHRGDVYATHGLGPVAQALDIHRGDRITTLVAMDTKSVVGKDLVEKRTGEECKEFYNGDHTTTLLRRSPFSAGICRLVSYRLRRRRAQLSKPIPAAMASTQSILPQPHLMPRFTPTRTCPTSPALK